MEWRCISPFRRPTEHWRAIGFERSALALGAGLGNRLQVTGDNVAGAVVLRRRVAESRSRGATRGWRHGCHRYRTAVYCGGMGGASALVRLQ